MPGVGEITDQLPTDIETLHAMVAAARAERDAALAERDRVLSQIDRLQHLLGQLQRAQFGRRSERLDPEQMLLAFEDIEQAIAGDERARRRTTRLSLRQVPPSAAPTAVRFLPICRASM